MSKWYQNGGLENDVVLCTRIRLARNLKEIPFPVRMRRPDALRLKQKIAAAIDQSPSIPAMRFVDMEHISKTEAVSFVERHLVSPEFISECKDRAILMNDEESLSMMMNGENHLHLQSIVSGLDLQTAYQSVDYLDSALQKPLHFAFDEHLGYLTQNPAHLGTGMHASLVLHLPALKDEGSIARISASFSKLGLVLRGIYGSATEPAGDLYWLSNQVTLGLSEQEALFNLGSIAMQIIMQERAARIELAQSIHTQDTISRSLGILKSARMMTNEEFMCLISNIRFGISAGLVEKMDYSAINNLLVEMQPATLVLSSGKKLTVSERHRLRAKKVSEVFQSAC
jgi:protein arginine kinase